ncbi:sulfotransferase family 2 domain-containing protein [Sorangium sp. So ce1389]|uniref:sulfotransferase family 2 domain-containing protein n=1 Tax=Sorangium sp. So ce1389 TaxID=3133336 RepID=UPI003F5F4F22
MERSASSIGIVPGLLRHFPDARFVHIYRDGREAALSASRFQPMRLMAISNVFETRTGKTLFEPLPPQSIPRLPPEMRPLVAPGFDVDAFLRVKIPLKYFGSVWSTQMVYGAAMFAGLPPERLLNLRYESILADPEPALRRLLSFLDPDLPQEAWLERALPLVRANPPKWPTLPPDERAALETSCARGMAVIEQLEHRPRAAPPDQGGESYQGGHDPESIYAELKRILVSVLELDIPPEQIRHTDTLFMHGMGIAPVDAHAIVREAERRFGVALFEEKGDMPAFTDVISLGQRVVGAMARGSRAAGVGERRTRTMQRSSFMFPPADTEPQLVQRLEADGTLSPSKIYLVNRPYPDLQGEIDRLVNEGHYLVGICALENWPARLHNPNDWVDRREYDLFIERSYHRFIGFMHHFRDPGDVFPDDVPLLEMDFSDYVQVRKSGQAKTFDMVYYTGFARADKPGSTRWSSTIKGHELAVTVIRTLLEVDPNFRVAVVNDVFGIDHPRVKNLSSLPYRAFLDLVESAHVLLVPSTLDASPRVITEALCLDTYVMVNADISGGWKYVNERTGAFFDRTNFVDVYTRLRARGPAATRGWFLENYANHTLEARFNGWLHDCILRYSAFNRFGKVLYVCLEGDRREKRQAMIRNELFRHMGIFGDCVEQVPAALVPGNPHKARGLSHLAALRRARALGLPDVVIFEDDFQFIVPRKVANRKIEALLRDVTDRDAILFGNHQVTRHEATAAGAVLRVRAGAWPHGYAVRAERYDELISGLAEACAAMPDNVAEGAPLIDDVWTRFAESANVHAFRVPLGEGMERLGERDLAAPSPGATRVEGSGSEGRADDLDAHRQSPPHPWGIVNAPPAGPVHRAPAMSNAGALLGIPAERWRAPEDVVRRGLNRSSYVSLRYRYLYMETPKVACTSMKTFVHRLERLPPLPPLAFMETRRSMAIHHRARFALPTLVRGISEEQAAEVLSDPSFFRFAFVRNPYARLYSAWRDKVHLVEPGYEWIAEAVRAASPDEVPSNRVPFAPFVKYVCAGSAGSHDPHWALQTAQLFVDAISYDMIGRLESLTTDFARVVEHLRRNGADDVDLTLGHLNQRSDGDWRAAYTSELADAVYARYREDFERFGYARESWRAAGGLRETDPAVTIRRLEEEIFERNRVIAMLNLQRIPSAAARAPGAEDE